MKILKVISTMNKKSIEDLNLSKKNISKDALIINQITDDSVLNKKIVDRENNITMMNFNEIGLSKSRNRGLENSNTDIVLLTDDDVVFKPNCDDIIRNAFEENKDADIITFQVKTPEGELFKNYSKVPFRHNKRSILKVSSIEIAIKKDAVDKYRVKYDEDFGLGSKYVSGEENIFLIDCIKKGMNIIYEPKVINIHPKETSGNDLDLKAIYSKGALFYRMFGISSILMSVYFVIKKRKILKNGLFKSICYIYKGIFDYRIYKKDEEI